jgi:cation transport ATPase
MFGPSSSISLLCPLTGARRHGVLHHGGPVSVLFVTACIAGGVTYAGLKTLVKLRPRKRKHWLVRVNDQAPGEASSSASSPGQVVDRDTDSHYFRLASASLGLSMAGSLIYPPLALASVPFTVYVSLPVFERAYIALFKELRFKMAVVHAIMVVSLLATQHYILVSLLNWFHYYLAILAEQLRAFNRILTAELEHSYRQLMSQIYGVHPRHVWVMTNGVGVEIPLEDLRSGDVIVVSAGEIVPVQGTIVEGTAEVVQFRPTRALRPLEIRPGDIVEPSTMVLSGKINIRVARV